MSEVFKSLATITSDAQGSGVSTVSITAEGEEAMEEEPSITDQLAEESPVVGEGETSKNEEGSRKDKPLGDSSMVEETNQIEKSVDEEKPSLSDELVERSSAEEKQLDTVGDESTLMRENANQSVKNTEVSSMLKKVVQSDKPLDESAMGTDGPSESDKLTEVSSMVQDSIPPDKLADETVIGQENKKTSVHTEESSMMEEPVQTNKPEKSLTSIMEELSQIDKPEESSTSMEESTLNDKPTEELFREKQPDNPTEICSVKEEDKGTVVMETDHHGNASETEDKQSGGQNESKSCAGSDSAEASRKHSEGDMGVDQLDQIKGQSADSSPVSQISTTG